VLDLVRAWQLREYSPGVPKIISVAAPGAGVETIATCPGGKIWDVKALTLTLTTSAVAGNRRPALVLDDGTTQAARLQSGVVTIASNATPYSWVETYAVSSGASNVGVTDPMPEFLTLASGWRLRTLTNALDPGDTWTAITLMVVEYFDGLTAENDLTNAMSRAYSAGVIPIEQE